MLKVVKIEQVRDGRWAVIEQSEDGTHKVIRTYTTADEAKAAASASDGAEGSFTS